MARFRKKPVVIEAVQWIKEGDHPAVGCAIESKEWQNGQKICQYCGGRIADHGLVKTLEGGHIVCPGDWIIPGVKGEHYPCKPDIFAATYDAITE